MKLTELRTDDDAVSPVIGVILMVAITVILAAVIASFVLGLGQQNPGVTTQASFTFDYDESDNNVTITHDSGDSLSSDNLYVRGDIDDEGNWTSLAGSGTSAFDVGAGNSVSDTISTNGEYTVRVVYETDEGSNTLQTHSGSTS